MPFGFLQFDSNLLYRQLSGLANSGLLFALFSRNSSLSLFMGIKLNPKFLNK
jgi:hypothetical protein